MQPILIAAALSLAAYPAFAAPDRPADPKAPVPKLRYESVFSGYEPASEITLGDWAAANAAVSGRSHDAHGSEGEVGHDRHEGHDRAATQGTSMPADGHRHGHHH